MQAKSASLVSMTATVSSLVIEALGCTWRSGYTQNELWVGVSQWLRLIAAAAAHLSPLGLDSKERFDSIPVPEAL